MVEKSAPIAQTERLFNLVPYLMTHQGISLKELATAFGVTIKEIIADLNTLWVCGLPGYTPLELIDLEFESGYVSIRNAEVLKHVRTLSSSEAIALQLGLGLLEPLLESEEAKSDMSSVRGKLSSITGKVAEFQADSQDATLAVVSAAISKRANIHITYLNRAKDSVSEREVTPLEIVRKERSAYLIAYCHSADAQRTFAIDAITQISISHNSQSVDASTANITEIYTSQSEQVEFKVFDRERTIIEALGACETTGGHYSAQIFSREWLTRAVIAFGPSIEILGSPEIVDVLTQRCNQILALYELPLQ